MARLREVVLTWVERGVRIFRVDNPHTKPLAFWDWLIDEVQRVHPGRHLPVGGLHAAEDDEQLAKTGFSQSYTYFTWRETRDELRDYLTELTQTRCASTSGANLFANTPDIFPHHLTTAGRPS